MTILCLVRDTRDGSWAMFSDCLITSDFELEGRALTTPHRPNYGAKDTFGFSEVALEEKIGFVDDQIILGWAGSRPEAVNVLAKIKARGPEEEIKEILSDRQNPYIAVQYENGIGFAFTVWAPTNQVHSVSSEGYEFIFAGSGSRILQGHKFTAKHMPLGQGAPNVAWAALTAVSRFMSEEMAGQDSQFYSLRTGGHYRIFYGHPDGIRQLHYCVNHWVKSLSGEPVVRSIVFPHVANSYECLVEFSVNESWNLSITNAIVLAPLLQSPRESTQIVIRPVDVLKSEVADCTFHVCWTENAHETFLTSVREPRFNFAEGFEKFPHEDATLSAVQSAFARMAGAIQ